MDKLFYILQTECAVADTYIHTYMLEIECAIHVTNRVCNGRHIHTVTVT